MIVRLAPGALEQAVMDIVIVLRPLAGIVFPGLHEFALELLDEVVEMTAEAALLLGSFVRHDPLRYFLANIQTHTRDSGNSLPKSSSNVKRFRHLADEIGVPEQAPAPVGVFAKDGHGIARPVQRLALGRR